MAELGESGEPRDLVPGDPHAIEENVLAIRGRGRSMADAGDGLTKIDAHSWRGQAGDDFRDKFSYEPGRWRQAGDSFEKAAIALEGYANTLRWAQGQAAEAVHQWDAGEAATRQAKRDHQAAVDHANQQNRHNATYGDGSQVPVPTFTDPGEAQRRTARAILDRARRQLAEAADTAAKTIWAEGDAAPETGFWEGVGDFFVDVGQGIADPFIGGGKLLLSMTGISSFWDDDFDRPMATTAQNALHLATHPAEFAKALTDWNTWADSPGRAIGHLLGGVVLPGVAGKVVSELSHLPGKHSPDVAREARLQKYGESKPDSDWVERTRVPYDPDAPGIGSGDPRVQKLLGSSRPHGVLEGDPNTWNKNYTTGKEITLENGTKVPELRYPTAEAGHPDGFATQADKKADWIEPGQRIDRFGAPGGQYLSPAGASWESRAIPPHTMNAPYHVYEVVKPVPAYSGPAASWFGQPGGATQYYLGNKMSVDDLLKYGYIREVTP